MAETDYLLRSPANAARLMAAADDVHRGHALITKSMEDLQAIADEGELTVKKVVFHPQGWEDFTHLALADRKMVSRIDDEHRLVYGATDDELIIIQARYHYDN